MSAKTLPVSVRLTPDMKKALETAAKDDDRSVSNMIEKVVGDWLKKNGYLPR